MPIELKIVGDNADMFLHEARGVLAALQRPETAGTADGFARNVVADVKTAADAPQSEKRGPGRPRKADAAPAPAETQPAPAAEAKPAMFTVRRYDGRLEGEYADSGTATEALVGLVREANDTEALDSLLRENSDEVQTWPQERRGDVFDAIDAVRKVLKSKAEAPAASSGPHFDLQGNVMTELAPTKQGAMNAVNAVVAAGGGNGGPGYQAARTFMDSLGVPRVSALGDDDPKIKQIVEWAAQRLGLPVAGGLT